MMQHSSLLRTRRIAPHLLCALVVLISTTDARPLVWATLRQDATRTRIVSLKLGVDSTADYQILNPDKFFSPDAPQIVCVWRVASVPAGGAIIRGVWVAQDTGGKAGLLGFGMPPAMSDMMTEWTDGKCVRRSAARIDA